MLRITQLQSGNPYRIEVLAMLSIDDPGIERLFHRRFGKDRLCGEWFARTPELMRTIGDVIAGHGNETPAPQGSTQVRGTN